MLSNHPALRTDDLVTAAERAGRLRTLLSSKSLNTPSFFWSPRDLLEFEENNKMVL